MEGRKDKLSQFTDLHFDDAVEQRNHYIPPPQHPAFRFEAEALPDKTLNELNSFQKLLPELQARHSLRSAFPMFRLRKYHHSFPAQGFGAAALFLAVFFHFTNDAGTSRTLAFSCE